jgi:hypothetical protein
MLAFVAPTARAEDPAPSPEQLTERTEELRSVWSTFQSNIASLRFGIDERLVSAGVFDGARARWFRTGFSVEGGAPITDRFQLGLSPTVAIESLSFDGSDTFASSLVGHRSTRLDDFLDAALRLGATYRFDHGFGAELLTSTTLRQERGAEFAESLIVGGGLGGSYRRGSWLRLRLGVGVGSDLGDGRLRVAPVFRVQLRPRPDLMFESSGLKGLIAWDVTRQLQLAVAGGLESTQYRLDRRRGPPVGLGSGALQRRQSRVALEADYRIRSWLRVRGDVGVALLQELTVLDEDGAEIDKREDHDPSPLVGIRFEIHR